MKNVQLLNVSTSLLALSLLASICFGCGAEGFDQMEAPPGAEEVEQVQQEIRGAPPEDDNIFKKGVVEINGCTGTMVGKYAIVTAAHCVLEGRDSHRITATVNYFDPYEATKRRVTAVGETLGAVIHPDYDRPGKRDSDLAFVYRLNYKVWGQDVYDSAVSNVEITTSPRDWVRISDAATCPQIDRNILYGQGYNSFAGEGLGTLRRASINIHSCHDAVSPYTSYLKDSFYSLAGSQRACMGDSGGPHMMYVNGWDVVVGVLISGRTPMTGTQRCTGSGQEQYSTRMSRDNVDWLIDTIGRDKCTRFYGFSERHPTERHYYWRCW